MCGNAWFLLVSNLIVLNMLNNYFVNLWFIVYFIIDNFLYYFVLIEILIMVI
jgi:hypothetical protein